MAHKTKTLKNPKEDNVKMKWKSRTRDRRSAAGLFLRVCAVCLLSSVAVSEDKNAGKIAEARTSLEKWVETQRVISQEKRDLVLAKEILTARIELVQREIEALAGKTKQTEESIAEADKKRTDMVEENEKLKQSSDSLSDTLVTLENRTQQLIQGLPDPLRQRIKPLSQRLPDTQNPSKLSISERFQNVVGILNEVDKFNREITMTSEVRTLPDGSSVEVAALYLGIGQAFYVGGNGTIAGTGRASNGRWEWKPKNEAAAQIAEVIAILKNEKAASFVRVPVEIQ